MNCSRNFNGEPLNAEFSFKRVACQGGSVGTTAGEDDGFSCQIKTIARMPPIALFANYITPLPRPVARGVLSTAFCQGHVHLTIIRVSVYCNKAERV